MHLVPEHTPQPVQHGQLLGARARRSLRHARGPLGVRLGPRGPRPLLLRRRLGRRRRLAQSCAGLLPLLGGKSASSGGMIRRCVHAPFASIVSAESRLEEFIGRRRRAQLPAIAARSGGGGEDDARDEHSHTAAQPTSNASARQERGCNQ